LSTLARSNYILALLFAILLFSLGGVPPLGGFFVKLDVLASIIQAGGLSVVIFLVLSTVLSFLYYLRVIKIMFFDQMRLTLSISLFSDSFKLLLISFLFVILVAYMFIVQRAYLLL
jgi:NADH-quinone oxidoreductase subunit N